MTSPPAIQRLSESLRTGSSGPGSLPPDVLAQSCRRVGLASLFFAAGWALSLAVYYVTLWLGGDANMVEPSGFPIPGIPVAATGLTLSLGMVVIARRLSDRPTLLLDVGLVFEVATAALIAFWNQWVPGVISGDISWVCAIILAYPAIAPSTPNRVWLAAFLAASMDPLWYGVAIARDAVPDPSVGDALMRFWPNYLCAVGAIVPTKLIRGLGRQVSRARELGSYQLGQRLGAGGMGEVFQAEHRLLARPAAIKLIRPDLLAAVTTQQASLHVERFRREAEAAALLRSPHTIELYDFGFSADGGFYYVMELLDGLSLEEMVTRYGPMPAERAAYLVLQACESIGEAHTRGLIHRDLKPSNLFTCRVGLQVDYVKVLDFGLVKGMAIGDATLTAPNIAAGTPAFMAPEVALGEADTDPRLDVYSLGCVLYWLLTGRLVFEGKSPGKIMHLHIQEPPEPPSRRTELPVPVELDALVLACLSKKPADRPANAEELRERLCRLGLASGWTRERAQHWWDAHRPRTSGPRQPCEGEHVVPAIPLDMTGPRLSPLDRVLRAFADVRTGEAVTALLLGLTAFLFLSSTYVARVLREPLILAGGGTGLSPFQLRSYTNAGAAALLLLVVPLYGQLAGRVPRRRLMNIVTPLFVAGFGAFFALAQLAVPVGVLFFTFVAMFNVMIVAQFWAFANDLYTDDEGKRLFPIIGVGASAGAAAGAQVARQLSQTLDLSMLFLVAGALLVLATLLTNVVDTRERRREQAAKAGGMTSGLLPAATSQYRGATGEFRTVDDRYRTASGLRPALKRGDVPPDEPETQSRTGAFTLVFRNPYLLLIAVLVLLLNWVNTSGEAILSDVVTRRAAAAAASPAEQQALIGSFYGGFYSTISIVTLLAQMFLVSRMIRFFGVRASLLVLPVIALGGYATMAFIPVLLAVRWAKILENSTDYSLNNTVRHALFLPTTREEKYKAKQVTDSFAQRTGDMLSALTVFIGTGLLGLAAARLAYVNLLLIAVWLVIAVLIGRRYERLAAATRL